MRYQILVVALFCCHVCCPAPSFAERRITLLNEIDAKTGHDTHVVAVQLFADRAEITYCEGTDLEHLLPLIRTLQATSPQPVTIRLVSYHEFDVDRRGWVIVGVCNNSFAKSEKAIRVWASTDVSRSTSRSIAKSFQTMRKLAIKTPPIEQLLKNQTPATADVSDLSGRAAK